MGSKPTVTTEIDIIPGVVKLISNVERVPRFHLQSHTPNGDLDMPTSDPLITAKYFVSNTHTQFENDLIDGNGISPLEGDALYLEQSIGIGKKAKMVLEFEEDSLTMTVNRAYHYYSNVTIDTFYSAGWHLRDALQYYLLNEGYSLLHSAAFEYNGEGVLILALSNVGKTTTLMNFVDRGANYVSEDICVTDGEHIYTCPYTFGPADLSRYIDTTVSNIYEHLHSIFPLVGHIKLPPGDIGDMVGKNNIISTTDIDQIFFLTKGEQESERISPNSAYEMALIQNRTEFHYHDSPLLSVTEFTDIDIDVFSASEEEEKIIKRTVQNADKITRLSGDPAFFVEAIEESI